MFLAVYVDVGGHGIPVRMELDADRDLPRVLDSSRMVCVVVWEEFDGGREQQWKGRRPRRRLSAEFKRDAVELVRTSGEPIAQVARDLGVGDSTLGNRVRQDQIDRGEREGLSSDERGELSELRRENAWSGDGP